MKASIRKLTGLFAVLAASALVFSCNDERIAGTSTETVTGKTAGRIYLADGQPAVGARIRVFSVDHEPLSDTGSATFFRTASDDSGRYYLDSLPRGEYNILGDLAGKATYQDSVFLSGTARTLDPVTLEFPGSVSGYIALQPGDFTAAATVQLLGTQAYANVDDEGFFTLPPLAPGEYRAAINVALPNYSVLYASVSVRSGGMDSLADTLRPRYLGIPQVTGLQAEFDTLAQQVRLTWSKTRFVNWKEYLVFRDPKGAVVKSIVPLTAVEDTFFVDNLFIDDFFEPPTYTGQTRWEYRVAIRDKRNEDGPTFGSLDVNTPPAAAASTVVQARVVSAAVGLASIGDTVLLIADYAGSNRRLKMLRWFKEGAASPLRTVHTLSKSGTDTLVFVCPNSASNHRFRVEIADDGGAEWMDSAALEVRVDQPSVIMAANATGGIGERFTAYAVIRDTIGEIAKIEWDIGGTGNWILSPNNDTVITLPNIPHPNYPCIVRVTDDDDLVAKDTTLVRILPWAQGPPMPEALVGPNAVAAGGKIYAIGTRNPGISNHVYTYDPAIGSWQARAPMPYRKANFAAAEWNGSIYLFGGTAEGNYRETAERYDPATDTWSSLPALPGYRQNHAVAMVGGKFYLIGGDSWGVNGEDRMKAIDVFDPATDTWSSFDTDIPFELQMRAAAIGNEIFVFSQYRNRSGECARFLPAENRWTPLQPFPHRVREDNGQILLDFAVNAVDGKIIVAGGLYESVLSNWADHRLTKSVFAYDPSSDTWAERNPMIEAKWTAALVNLGDTLFVLGGLGQEENIFQPKQLNDIHYNPGLN